MSEDNYRWALDSYHELLKEMKQMERELAERNREIRSLKVQLNFQHSLTDSLRKRWQLTEARLFRIVDGLVPPEKLGKYILYLIKGHKVPF